MANSDAGDELTLPEPLVELPSFVMFQLIREARRIIGGLGNQSLRLPHLGVLSALTEFGPAAQRDLAARLDVDASDLVSVLDDLERAELVHRQRDNADRRRYVVTITEAGEHALDRRMAASRELDTKLFAPLSLAEREQLHELLLRCYASHAPGRLPATFQP
jgi:MarR family transcriptional regulator, lower aerobic nicotinate degradation pathway regulator